MENDLKTVDYRLTNIEKTLHELKNVIVENKLQARDIQDLSEKHEELMKAVNAHDKRLHQLETRPMKASAERWQYILDYIFKGVVAAAAALVLAKLGIRA